MQAAHLIRTSVFPAGALLGQEHQRVSAAPSPASPTKSNAGTSGGDASGTDEPEPALAPPGEPAQREASGLREAPVSLRKTTCEMNTAVA